MVQGQKGKGVLLVLAAATLWGTLGTLYTFGRERYGLEPLTIVFWRAALAAICLALVLAVIKPLVGKGWPALRVARRDLPIFLTFGLLGVTAFFLLYIYAVLLVGVAVAVVLLYTAPAFVALMSWRVLGETFGARKVVALFATLIGCALVARLLDTEQRLDPIGILCGLGSAVTYALYSILGKQSLRRGYAISTMMLYTYTIGAAGLLTVALFGDPQRLVAMGTDPGAWGLLLLLATVQTLGTLALYTTGLRYLEASVASIVATFELVVAALLAVLVLQEPLTSGQLAGAALIAFAVITLSINDTTFAVKNDDSLPRSSNDE